MARAKTITWLSLDEWAQIIGVNPLHFNGFSSDFFQGTTCGQPWRQYPWQAADRVGREDVARAIRSAERKIAGYVGYSLLPEYVIDERTLTDRPLGPGLFSINGKNVRGQWKTVETFWNHVISGGQRVKVGIETAPVVRSDSTGDGYDDLVTLTVGTSVTDPDEIKCYYPGEDAADEWEIRPINVSIAANVATITFNSWQIMDPNLMEAMDAETQDADTAGNYLSTVDVYRVYLDPSAQVSLMWEADGGVAGASCCGQSTCVACQHNTQTACLRVRNERLGMVNYMPAEWDAANSRYNTQAYSSCREPDKVRLWYLAGWQDKSLSRPMSQMDNFWAVAVAYFSCALLSRPACGCDQIQQFIEHWRVDRAKTRDLGAGHQISSYQRDNPLGSTTNGALYALARADEDGRKVAR